MSKIIYAAIAEIQRGAVLVKRNSNATLNSRYADLADVRAFLDPLLERHGLGVSFLTGGIRECPPGKLVTSLTLEIIHAESGEVLTSSGEYPVPEGNRAVTGAQAYGSSLTYAMRYALVSRFGLVTGDDDDAQRARAGMASHGRDAAPEASETTHWKLLMEGFWGQCAAPNGQLIEELTLKERALMLEKNTEHAGLVAWAADRLDERLHELEMSWARFCERIGGAWPETMQECTGEQIVAAGKAAKGLSS